MLNTTECNQEEALDRKKPNGPWSSNSDDDDREEEGKGRWTRSEHDRFMHAVAMYPRGPWKQIGAIVKTRSIRQIQTHAQKLREKAARHERGLKIKIKDQLAVTLPPFLWSKGHGREAAAEEMIKQEMQQEDTDPNLPSLEECLDFLIEQLDDGTLYTQG